MTRMMTDPAAVANAQIYLFYNMLGIWQKTAERMLLLRARDTDTRRDRRFKHPEWSENSIFNFVKDSGRVASFCSPRSQGHGRCLCSQGRFLYPPVC
jgi:polyhydroxyalkanoate synthase subunit PhaC